MDYKDYQQGYREDFCYFKAKVKLVEGLLNKIFSNFTHKLKILDIGPGMGKEPSMLSRYGEVIIVDIEPEVVNKWKKTNFTVVLGDVCNLPFENEEFDVIIAMDVFEHISEDSLAIQEVYRVLKNGGWLIFSVPAYSWLYSNHDVVLKHFRRYNRKEILYLLSKFFYKKIYHWNFIFFLPIMLLRIVNKYTNTNYVKKIKFPNFINYMVYTLLLLENFFILHNFSFPFGLSILGLVKK